MKTKLLQQADKMLFLHEGLSYKCDKDGIIFEGIYWLDHTYDNIHLCEDYNIKIHIPWDFPLSLPEIWEISNKIPIDGAFEHFHRVSNNALCLGANCDLFTLLDKNPTIVGFIDNVLPSYLFAAKYFYKYGVIPEYGERLHGIEGVLQAYKERYNAPNDKLLFELLLIIAKINPYRGHLLCPCGSGAKLRDCHGKHLLADIKSIYYNYYFVDARIILNWYIHKQKENERIRQFSKSIYSIK